MFYVTPSLGLRVALIVLIGLLLVASGAQAGIESWLLRVHDQVSRGLLP